MAVNGGFQNAELAECMLHEGPQLRRFVCRGAEQRALLSGKKGKNFKGTKAFCLSVDDALSLIIAKKRGA
jgi:hypothetical protein